MINQKSICPRNATGITLINDYAATAIICGLFLASSPSVNFGGPDPVESIYKNSRGSDFFRISSIISGQNTTWSSVAMYDIAPSSVDNIHHSVKFLKQLSFLEGDFQAEKDADSYFDSIPIKKRKVLTFNRS